MSNRFGSYYLWTDKPYSKYCGLFFRLNGKVYKCVEEVTAESELHKNEDSIVGISNTRKDFSEYIYLSNQNNAVAYKYSGPVNIKITLDVREANDLSDWGREYTFNVEDGCILAKYTKRGSNNPDENYVLYIAIKSSSTIFEKIDNFAKITYDYDKLRHSVGERYVCEAISTYTSFFTMSMSTDKARAIEKATALYKNYSNEIKSDERYQVSTNVLIHDEEIRQAYKNANVLFQKLICDEGIYAGIPWFFQFWSRDELISVGYLIRNKMYAEAYKIIGKYVKMQTFDGRLKAIYPDKGNMSADGAGWMFLRYAELYREAAKNKKLSSFLSETERKSNIEALEKMLFALRKYHIKDGLTFSGKDETWMDTSIASNERVGYCVEIQALTLRLLNEMHYLTGDDKYLQEEIKYKDTVKKKFFENGIMYDSIDGLMVPRRTPRPNLFIAYYVCPWLLENNEWEKVFDNALSELWLDWGGLSSIGKNDMNFIDTYTGENNISYHRGDSWFFLNCMAAIAMFKVNKEKYSDKINAIVKACAVVCKDQGVIGSVPEVSSAKELSSYGCLVQAWSLALFVELVETVNGVNCYHKSKNL